MNRGSVFPYPQYNRTIVLCLSYRNDIFTRAASHNKNNKKNIIVFIWFLLYKTAILSLLSYQSYKAIHFMHITLHIKLSKKYNKDSVQRAFFYHHMLSNIFLWGICDVHTPVICWKLSHISCHEVFICEVIENHLFAYAAVALQDDFFSSAWLLP